MNYYNFIFRKKIRNILSKYNVCNGTQCVLYEVIELYLINIILLYCYIIQK